MKAKMITLALFICTAALVAAYPAIVNSNAMSAQPTTTATPATAIAAMHRPRIELVFVLDTTASMGGLIQAAKDKIWSIATTMASAQPAPEISIGLVAYRDRGDAYVTRTVDLSTDLDSLYVRLMELQAQGGGDGPEAVNEALYQAVHGMSWSQDPRSYQVVFLVGDAPPHMDYPDDVKYPLTLAAAAQRGIVINTILCGENELARQQWQQIAQANSGQYFQVEQAGSAVAIATPFDADIAALSQQLDATRWYYGSAAEKAKQQRKLAAADTLHALASPESRARRATFNASASGAGNFLGDKELVEDIASGRVDLADIDAEALPAALQAMSSQQRQAVITEAAEKREQLQRQIKALASERDAFVDERIKQRAGIEESLDYQIYHTIREQAEKKGLHYTGGPEF
jgi:Mg-chelatase subunit ChlD